MSTQPIKQSGISPKNFLPTSRQEMKKRGWRHADIILVTADAYVDHPSFGIALIGRYLESLGYRVAILDQPDWKSADDFKSLGKPNLFFAITSGAVDSRLNNYASLGHKRNEDLYSPSGQTGNRPDKPLLTFAARAKEAFNDVPIILGGLEASLRRLVHYDYIEDKIKRSVLTDAKADILVHGMGELAIAEIARRLKNGEPVENITGIHGTAFPVRKDTALPTKFIVLPSLEKQQKNPQLTLDSQIEYQRQCVPNGMAVVQDQDPGQIVVMPPARALTTEEMDQIYDLPFTRCWHPKYNDKGGIPALEPVKFSVTTHRGCFGGCSFCSIYFHQGKQISSRSIENILKELDSFDAHSDFKGTVHDIGGPSANMYGMGCSRKDICNRPSCLYPNICKQLKTDHGQMLKLMTEVVRWKKLRKKKTHAFIASGVRFDLANLSPEYISLLCREFTGGHLKVAPEHYCDNVLQQMGKPSFSGFEKFERNFERESNKCGKQQYLVPYFISSHPGCSDDDAIALTEYLVGRNWQPRQVQDFTPSPLSLSTAMYVAQSSAGGKKLYTAKGHKAKKLQAALLQYYRQENIRLFADLLRSKGKHKLLARIQSIARQKQAFAPQKRSRRRR
ncbi:MAG: YgiQ family radical SAM protein [Sedimentisphaeraceae bacterium JB056]